MQNTSDEQLSALAWQRNMPFVNTWHIQQLETLAWQHSNYWGLRMQEYKSLDRGTVIQQHVLNYQRALPKGCLGVYDNIRQCCICS
jgi:acyl-CoA thioester hydrolase